MMKSISSLCYATAVLFSVTIQAQLRYLKQDMVLVNGTVDTLYFANNEVYENPAVTDTIGYYAVSKIEDFYMSAYCVSEFDYQIFSKATKRELPPAPSWGWGDYKKPMVNVSYRDALDFCRWLSDSLGVRFRLPSSQEWEFVASEGKFYKTAYDYDIENDDAIIVHKDNNRVQNKPSCITCVQPNTLGIYDLLGNVWEITHGQEAKGGSFLSPREEVTQQSTKSISVSEIAEDMGFRIVAEAEDFNKYLTAQEANRLTYFVFGTNTPFWFSAKGIHNESETIPKEYFESFFIDVTEYHAGFYVYTSSEKSKATEKFLFKFPKEKIEAVVRLQDFLENNFFE